MAAKPAELFPNDHIDVNSIVLPLPRRCHVELSEQDIKQRMIVVGDIHGCVDEFKELLEQCRHDPQTTSVLLLGDLVNKGPYSAEVVQFARKIGALCIRGNHDDYALKFALGLVPQPTPAHLAYLNRLTSEDVEWLKELPYTISAPSLGAVFVHAGLVPGRPLGDQAIADLITMRNVVIDSNTGTLSGSSKGGEGGAWAESWQGLSAVEGALPLPVTVFFGHDAKRGLQMHPQAVGLDTGCAYGRKLSAMILPERMLVQVQARQAYQAIVEKE